MSLSCYSHPNYFSLVYFGTAVLRITDLGDRKRQAYHFYH